MVMTAGNLHRGAECIAKSFKEREVIERPMGGGGIDE
jgi:hypothetical protein